MIRRSISLEKDHLWKARWPWLWDYDLCLRVAEGLLELAECQLAVSLPLPKADYNPIIVMGIWLSINTKYTPMKTRWSITNEFHNTIPLMLEVSWSNPQADILDYSLPAIQTSKTTTTIIAALIYSIYKRHHDKNDTNHNATWHMENFWFSTCLEQTKFISEYLQTGLWEC